MAASVGGKPIPKPRAYVVRRHEGPVRALAVRAIDGTLFSAGESGIAIWLLSGPWVLGGPQPMWIGEFTALRATALAFSPDEQCLYFATEDGRICRRRLGAESDHRIVFADTQRHIVSLAHAPFGTMLCSRDGAGALTVWTEGDQYEVGATGGMGMAFGPLYDEGLFPLYFGCGTDVHRIRCSLRENDYPLSHRMIIHRHSTSVQALALSPDGTWLCCAGLLGMMNVVSTVSRIRRPLDGLEFRTVSALAFTPDGLLICAGDLDGVVSIFDRVSGVCIWKFDHAQAVTALALSPDARYLCVNAAPHGEILHTAENIGVGPDVGAITVYDFGGPNLGTSTATHDDLLLDRPDLWPDAPEE